tara:strand:- start:932 stop:1405 length:474 start_codon:yes stop_codon:yes gene_type:complete
MFEQQKKLAFKIEQKFKKPPQSKPKIQHKTGVGLALQDNSPLIRLVDTAINKTFSFMKRYKLDHRELCPPADFDMFLHKYKLTFLIADTFMIDNIFGSSTNFLNFQNKFRRPILLAISDENEIYAENTIYLHPIFEDAINEDLVVRFLNLKGGDSCH